ncbi:MAG: hypothetical protein QMD36_05320 [Candidatus Aenigmarchaeota archaeon]|nr:hypothetical protein [Candidatus Aenigmarchaeota archaeon]
MILKSLSEGIRFAFSPKVIVPYLILDLIIGYTLIQFFMGIFDLITMRPGIFGIFLFLGIYLPIFILIGLVYLWVNGAIIDQAKYYPKRRSLAKSFGYSGSRYLTLLCASILYGIIIAIASSPPYIGSLISFVVSLFLFFLYPAIIVDRKGCIDSFKKSFNIFSRYPLETFVTWLVMGIISLIVAAIFASPLLFFVIGWVGMPRLLTPVGVEPQTTIKNLLPIISDAVRSPYFIVYLFILCVGLYFSLPSRDTDKTVHPC